MKYALSLVMAAGLLAICLAVPAQAQDLQPGPGDRCPVCNMKVTPHPEWISVIRFKDGTYNFFDGTKCMFNMIFDFGRYLSGYCMKDVESIRVTEHDTLKRYDACEVYFVGGSDVLGPMQQELVPVANVENLRTFVRDHGYDRVMRFDGKKLVVVPF